MKDLLLTILTAIGVILILVIATYYPYYSIYDFVLQECFVFVMGGIPTSGSSLDFLLAGMPANTVPFRLKITLGALVISAIIILVMFFLRKASIFLNVSIFERILKWGMFYVGVMTILMLSGMWLDFKVMVSDGNTPSYIRISYFFYLITI